VKEVALKYGMPYNDQPTLRSAVRSHQRMLVKLGRDAWRAATAPAVARRQSAVRA